jgi:ABC-2 type transport system permease protein
MTAISPSPTLRPGSRLISLWTLWVLTLRQYLHGKRWLIMGALFLLPAGLALLVRCTRHNVPLVDLEFLFGFMFIPQALLPLVALIYASGMIQDEQEEQTITYLLIRPLPRWMIYAAKLAATIVTTVVLTAVFTALTYAAIYAGSDPGASSTVTRCLQAICLHSLAVTTYCCLFGLMSLLTKRTLVYGILYTSIVEGLFANMAFSIRLITVIYYCRVIAYRWMDFSNTANGGSENMAADAWQLGTTDIQLAQHPSPAACVATLLIASLVFAAAGAFICSRREFHVKTPEKS